MNGPMFLGIHAGHDANVSLLDGDGRVLFAAGEERFNRIKMYAGFPEKALRYVIDRFAPRDVRLATPRLGTSAKALRELLFFVNSFRKGLAAPRFGVWLQVGMKKLIRGRTLETHAGVAGIDPAWPVDNIEHHVAHAASAFYPSGFERCKVMTLDGEGDGYSCCLFDAGPEGLHRTFAAYHNEMTTGRDYEKVTAMLGFHPLRHPGKITGLAAYGTCNEACIDALEQYLRQSWRTDRRRVLSTSQAYQVISDEGRAELMHDRQTRFKDFSREDLSFAIQYLTERDVLDLLRKKIPDPAAHDIALAGGVFANVALNKKIKQLGFRRIFIQPAMSDAGLSLGAALDRHPRRTRIDPFSTVYFGPSFTADEVRDLLVRENVTYEEPADPAEAAAELLAQGKVLARCSGPMEFGPRALGNRTIMYHAGDPSVNDWLNRQLKRSEFMPFAPVTLERFAGDCYIDYEGAERASKFMTITFECTEAMKKQCPAVVHVDGTARPQVIAAQDNPEYAAIVEAYYRKTGIPTVVNTSFNMHEEPIVMTPMDALRAFTASRLDAMLLGPFLLTNR